MESIKQYKYTYNDMAKKSPRLHVKHVLHELPFPREVVLEPTMSSFILRFENKKAEPIADPAFKFTCLLH